MLNLPGFTIWTLHIVEITSFTQITPCDDSITLYAHILDIFKLILTYPTLRACCPALCFVSDIIHHGLKPILAPEALVFHRPPAILASAVAMLTLRGTLQVVGHFELHAILARVAYFQTHPWLLEFTVILGQLEGVQLVPTFACQATLRVTIQTQLITLVTRPIH